MSPRPVDPAQDFPAMLHLARLDEAAQVHLVDLPYRLSSWAFDTPENTAVWVEEERLLAPLVESLNSGRVQADHWLTSVRDDWKGDFAPMYAAASL